MMQEHRRRMKDARRKGARWAWAWLCLLGMGLWGAGVGGRVHASGPEPGLRSERGSVIHFHGWSTNSRWIAYTREYVGSDKEPQRMHRLVEGGAFAGFGSKVGGDVARYAKEQGYMSPGVTRIRRDDMEIVFRTGVGEFLLRFVIGARPGWQLEQGGGTEKRVLKAHVFDRIYVGFDAALFPSPDGTQAILIMHLDTGWEIDAAVFPLRLP